MFLILGPSVIAGRTALPTAKLDKFMAKPTSQNHLYEIHTVPQGELVPSVMSTKLVLEIARLQDDL